MIRLILLAALLPTAAPPAGPMRSTLRADGTLLVDGVPTLPYGFYISTGHTGDRRLRCVELVHAAGGNVVHIEGPWDADTRFLDKAVELGVRVVAGHTETESKLGRVRTFRDHPAIVAWTLYDDANTKSTVAHLTKMDKLVKGAVPHRLTFIPLGTQSKTVPMPAAEFFACADIIGWENYPIARTGAADPTVRATETQMVAVQELAAKAKRPVWVLPQTFAWPGSRVPTPAEYRNICYVGLVNNAKGVMSWSIYHKGDSPEETAKLKAAGQPAWAEWYLPDSKELWAECGLVGRELKEIAPAILSDRYEKLTKGGDVTAAAWVGDTGTLVVAANLTDQPAAVDVKLPAGAAGAATPAFNTRPAGLRVEAGRLAGKLGPAEVGVYRVTATP